MYDAAGNQKTDGTHNYTFNAANQITQMVTGAAVYTYDGDGRRMKKTVGTETTYYFYAVGVLVSEFSTTNTGATAAASTDRTTYQTSDKLGTAVLIMAAAGLVVENNRTLPYGEEWQPAVGSENEQKFTSYQRDSESGLDYAIHRFDATARGVFMSVDPGPVNLMFPQSLNRYTYAMADPVNFTDPDGMQPQTNDPPPYNAYAAFLDWLWTRRLQSLSLLTGDPVIEEPNPEVNQPPPATDDNNLIPRLYFRPGLQVSVHAFFVGINFNLGALFRPEDVSPVGTLCFRVGPGLYVGAGITAGAGISDVQEARGFSGRVGADGLAQLAWEDRRQSGVGAEQ